MLLGSKAFGGLATLDRTGSQTCIPVHVVEMRRHMYINLLTSLEERQVVDEAERGLRKRAMTSMLYEREARLCYPSWHELDGDQKASAWKFANDKFLRRLKRLVMDDSDIHPSSNPIAAEDLPRQTKNEDQTEQVAPSGDSTCVKTAGKTPLLTVHNSGGLPAHEHRKPLSRRKLFRIRRSRSVRTAASEVSVQIQRRVIRPIPMNFDDPGPQKKDIVRPIPMDFDDPGPNRREITRRETIRRQIRKRESRKRKAQERETKERKINRSARARRLMQKTGKLIGWRRLRPMLVDVAANPAEARMVRSAGKHGRERDLAWEAM